MMRYISFLLIFLLAGCATHKKTIVLTGSNTSAQSSKATEPYQPTAQKHWELVSTNIDISFNFQQKTANVLTQISMHPYFYTTDSVVLDAKGMKILNVKGNGGQDLIYAYDDLKLRIKLPEFFQQQDTLLLEIQAIAMPYATEATTGKAISQDRGLYFVNADKKEPYQPLQIWTQGETEANSHWFPTFDKTNFRSSFKITMHVPDSLKTISNGKLVQSVAEKNNQRADTWVQELPIPPYLVMMAVGNFHVEQDFWKNKEVNYLVPQKYAGSAKGIFNHTPEMIDYFSNLLKVDYPWDKYSQVAVYNYVSGAMENVSASLFGAFTLKDNRQLKDGNNDYIVAHELFHQWFGDYVTAESWSQITLNESFADYGEKLWADYKYGAEVAEVQRINSWNKYRYQAVSNDPPLVRHHYNTPDDVFDRVSYSKGGLILYYLQQILGDKAFFEGLHLYLTQNALQSAEADQLRLSFEKVTGRDLKWFFDEWYFRGGHPVLTIDYEYNQAMNEMTAIVTQIQKGPLYHLPLKAQLVTNGASQMVDWQINEKQERFSYPYASGDEMIIIPDAGFWLPGLIVDHKTAAQLLLQMKYAKNLMPKYRVLDALHSKSLKEDSIRLIIDLALKDPNDFIKITALNYLSSQNSLSLAKEMASVLGNLSASNNDPDLRATAFYLLGNMKVKEFASTYERAISDSSYKVAAAGLYAMEQINHHKATELARALLPHNFWSSLFTSRAARVIAKEANVSDFSFFEERIWHYFESDRQSFFLAFFEYLDNLRDSTIFKKGIDITVQLIDNDVTSGKRIVPPLLLYSLYRNADRKMRAAKEKPEIAIYKVHSDYTFSAYEIVKASLKDEKLLQSLKEMEEKTESP